MAELQVVAYLRATKKEEPVWSEDCVCQDPVYPSDPDGSDENCISMPLVRLSEATARIAEARREALEEAAKICDEAIPPGASTSMVDVSRIQGIKHCAAAIRSAYQGKEGGGR